MTNALAGPFAGSATFYVLAAAAVASALGVVLSRNLVHAVLFMVANFIVTAGLYVMLRAPFIAMTQIVVYAGAIMVLFLFVVMLIGRQELDFKEHIRGHRALGMLLVIALAVALVLVVVQGVPAAPEGASVVPPSTLADDFGSPSAIGDSLFRYHVLAFEIISVLLLVAILGAVVISKVGSGQVLIAEDGVGESVGVVGDTQPTSELDGGPMQHDGQQSSRFDQAKTIDGPEEAAG